MYKLTTAAAALMISAVVMNPITAQAATLEEAVGVCSIVVDLQYANNQSRNGDCVGSAQARLETLGAPSAGADGDIVELVSELSELFRNDPDCRIADTELPEAIALASKAIVDDEVRNDILLIAEQIRSCDYSATASVPNFVPGASISGTSGGSSASPS